MVRPGTVTREGVTGGQGRGGDDRGLGGVTGGDSMTNAHKTNAHKTYAHNTNGKRDICSQLFL